MKDNKLIAEFMGVGNLFEPQSSNRFNNYHNSWDDLMPVVLKCFDQQEKVTDDLSFKLNDALLETNINTLRQAVIEFINEYNNKFLCGSCGEFCSEYTYNKETDVDQCNKCKPKK